MRTKVTVVRLSVCLHVCACLLQPAWLSWQLNLSEVWTQIGLKLNKDVFK